MSRIKILSENLCNKIAAGEVVERPASVVKELVENSLDAGADEILVEVETGGKKLIRIQDNGSGMSRDETFLSVERHATSKIETDEDLFRLTTLGFRGEALPSIASVSMFNIQSRDKDSDAGWQLRIKGGRVESADAVGMPIGTTVEVRNLFFNTPARRKFLRRDQTEIGHVGDVVSRQALAQPDVRFRLIHNGRTIVDALKSDRLEERVASILGREAVREMVPLMNEADGLALHGLVSRPLYNRSATTSIYTYINGRYIRDRVVQHAVMEGYRNLLMKGRYPVVVLFLDLPPEMVDVNVHPTKHEVRFREQNLVHGFISSSVRNALRPAVSAAETPAGDSSANCDVFGHVAPALSAPPATRYRPETAVSGESVKESSPEPWQPIELPVAARREEPSEKKSPFQFPEQESEPDSTGSMAIIGQFRESYILCQDADELVLIDQHAAHERIGFERLKKQFFGNGIEKQSLLFPVVIEFDFREATQLQERLNQLSELGFDLEPFGGKSYALKATPQLLGDAEAEHLLRDVASELAEMGESGKIEDAFEHILATMACHSVVRANQKLTFEAMRSLLREIDTVDFSAHCPHGRPVMRRISLAEIERMFKRT